MRFLLDTHAVIWLTGRTRPVRPELFAQLQAEGTVLLVSAVSAFETTLKVRLGKLDRARRLADDWENAVSELGALPLALTHAHAVSAGRLEWEHRDPFDRLLAAQAVTEDLTLVTADPVFRGAPDLDLLPW